MNINVPSFDCKTQLFIMRYIPSHLHKILWSKMPSGGGFSSKPLSRLRCMDGSGEYTSAAFSSYLAENRIKCELTNAYTPQENGVSKHVNCTLNNLACSMIADAKVVLQTKSLPASLWSQAIHHVAWIKNRTLTRSIESKFTLYQIYFGKKPSLKSLHLFGCKAYAHTPKINQSKFGDHTTECVCHDPLHH